MPAIENIHLARQAVRLLSNVRRDERANAQSYKARLDRGDSVALVAEIMVADANAYLRVLKQLKNAVDDATVADKLDDGLTRLNIPTTEARSLWRELRDAAVHQRDADLSTDQAIRAEADWVLANVTHHDRLW